MRTRTAVAVFAFLLFSCNDGGEEEDGDVDEEIIHPDVDMADVDDADEPECLNDLYCDDHLACTEDICDPGTRTCINTVITDTSTLCRDAGDVCDAEEYCDGINPECPPDIVRPNTHECRAVAGLCDTAERCTGTSAVCPEDAFLPETGECREAVDECDTAEYCTGASADCPEDVFLPDTTECREAADVCDVAESCTGTSAGCPEDAFLPDTTECREAADVCDVAESCTGMSAACPDDVFLPDDASCRPVVGPCDAEELCTGESIACPDDGFLEEGAVCDDDDYCTTDTECNESGDCLGTSMDVLFDVADVAAGRNHTCALLDTAGVKCWGRNDNGQLGTGTTDDATEPMDVSGLASGVAAVSGGYAHTCALLDTGGVKCWGANNKGQIGDGTTIEKTFPVDVSGLTLDATILISGGEHNCVRLDSETVKCWGNNYYGQLGDGTTVSSSTPVDVLGLPTDLFGIAAGVDHTCILLDMGGVQCWGRNDSGQIGDGTTENRTSPTAVSGLSSGVTFIAAGYNHTCALLTTGGVKCWGGNEDGQLGNDTRNDALIPVDVEGLASGVSAIAAGASHTCAILTAGGVKCWGNGDDGQIGNGAPFDRLTPVYVVGLSSGLTAITGGGKHTCGLLDTGTIQCWGDNFFGQLGDGTSSDRLSPTDVLCN